MDVHGIWSGLFAGIGGAIGKSQAWGFWLTLATQAVIAALLVLPFSFATRNRLP